MHDSSTNATPIKVYKSNSKGLIESNLLTSNTEDINGKKNEIIITKIAEYTPPFVNFFNSSFGSFSESLLFMYLFNKQTGSIDNIIKRIFFTF